MESTAAAESHAMLEHVKSWKDIAPTQGVTRSPWRRTGRQVSHDRHHRAILLEACPSGQTCLACRVHGEPEEATEPDLGAGPPRGVSKWREGEVWRKMCQGARELQAQRTAQGQGVRVPSSPSREHELVTGFLGLTQAGPSGIELRPLLGHAIYGGSSVPLVDQCAWIIASRGDGVDLRPGQVPAGSPPELVDLYQGLSWPV